MFEINGVEFSVFLLPIYSHTRWVCFLYARIIAHIFLKWKSSAKLCAGGPADFGVASDVSDTLPFDVSMAATPSIVEEAVSPDHSAQAKRETFQKKPKETETDDKELVDENKATASEVETAKGKNETREEPKKKTHVKKNDPDAPKTKKEIPQKEVANPFTPSDAEARYMCGNQVCCKGWPSRITDLKKSH